MRARVETSSGSLVIFTVFAQAAVGASLIRVVLQWVLHDVATPAAVQQLTAPLLPVAAGLLAVALLGAPLHLARPRAARFAVSHVGSSWLSREIVLGSLFGAALLLELVLGWLGQEVPALGGALAPVTVLLGLAFVYAIGRVYCIRTVPAWDTWATPFAFFSATLLLGAVAAAVVLVLGNARSDLVNPALHALSPVVLTVAGAEIVVMVLHLRRLERGGGAATQSARVFKWQSPGRMGLRTFCGAFGALLFHGTTWPSHGSQAGAAILIACGLLLASELLARSLFYASHRRVGL